MSKYIYILTKIQIFINNKLNLNMDNKITDSDLLNEMCSKLTTEFYTFGAYSEYDRLDVKNIKNEIIEAIKNKDGNN